MTLSIPLGKWKAAPNCIWRVLFNAEEGGTLEVLTDQEGVIIYTPGDGGRFHKQGRAEHRVPRGVPARVKPINEDTLKLMQIGRPFNELPSEEEEDKPEFMEFLRAWGGEWMWEDVQLNETPEWAAECLRTGDLVCVTDGSYNKKTAPDICSAG